MPTQFTTNVNFPYPQQGIDVLWGTTLNFEINTDDLRWGSTYTQNLSNVTPIIFPTSNVAGFFVPTQYNCIRFIGALTSDIIIQFPPGVAGAWFVENFTTGAHTITLQVGSGPLGTTYQPIQSYRSYVRSDGTNMDSATNAPFWVLSPPIPNNTVIANTSGSSATPLPVNPSTLNFSSNLEMGGGTILDVATPVNPTDGVNKSYVDTLFAGIKFEPSAQKLVVSNNATTPNTKIDISAKSAQMVNALNSPISRSSISLTIDATTNGANGLDTGFLAANSTYHIYIIDNGTITAGLLSLSSTSPSLPSGYTYTMRVGAFRTGGSSTFLQFKILGNRAQSVANVAYPQMASVAIISNTTITLSNFVPTTATQISIQTVFTTNGGDSFIYVDPTHIGDSIMKTDVGMGPASITSTFSILSPTIQLNVTFLGGSAICTLSCIGWIDSVNAT